MKRSRFNFLDITLWGLVVYLTLHVPLIQMRTNDDEMHKYVEQPEASTEDPESPVPADLKHGKCFHMPRAKCPADGAACARVDLVSVFCCDVDSFRLKEGLQIFMTQNTTNLHVLNANIDELNVSAAMFRRLASMALTDGNIGKIVGQFPKYSSIACLNISNNNLTSAKLEPSSQRPFAYLFNLSVLDASANNLTEFPLSLVQSNRKISVDFSGNNYLPCKHFQRAMEASNSSLVTFVHYEHTYCALDLRLNTINQWFKDVQIVNIDYIKKQKELNERCLNIWPANANCKCVHERLELMMGGEISNAVAVDCSQRHLADMPTNLPANTVKLNVSYNNITSLQAVGDDPSYEHLRQLIVDYNYIGNIIELEGTKFIDNFMLFSITHNKLKTIHTYVLSNKFDTFSQYTTVFIGGNYIHCDCNTEKVLKPWLIDYFKNIPDFKSLQCEGTLGPVVELLEFQVCHTPRDWTDYIYYIIDFSPAHTKRIASLILMRTAKEWNSLLASVFPDQYNLGLFKARVNRHLLGLEVLFLVLLISKVSYDYWVFKTAGYLPWPANKMPRLPCDWLCE